MDEGKEKNNALEKMQQLCSGREKCSTDIRQKLVKYKLSEKDNTWIINRLIADRFIDEERYARIFVRDKFRLSKWGRKKIRFALIMKKIPDQIIEEALLEIDQDIYRDTLTNLLAALNKKTKSEDVYKRKARLYRFASQRGFESELIQIVLNEDLGISD